MTSSESEKIKKQIMEGTRVWASIASKMSDGDDIMRSLYRGVHDRLKERMDAERHIDDDNQSKKKQKKAISVVIVPDDVYDRDAYLEGVDRANYITI